VGLTVLNGRWLVDCQAEERGRPDGVKEMFSVDEIEWQKHAAAITADGFVLGRHGFENLTMWNYILMQLHNSRYQLRALIDHKPTLGDMEDIQTSLARFSSAIMDYSRCFVSVGKKHITLDAKLILKERPDLFKTHKRMMSIRNTLIAHTDHSDLIRAVLAVKEETDRIVIRHVVTYALPGNEMRDFLEIIEEVERYVVLRLNRHLWDLEEKFGKSIVPG
jgi:hypothetical protein